MTVDSLRWISFKRISRWVMLCCSPRVLPLLLFTCPICSTLHWKTLRLLCVCVVLVSVSVTAATQSRFIRNPSSHSLGSLQSWGSALLPRKLHLFRWTSHWAVTKLDLSSSTVAWIGIRQGTLQLIQDFENGRGQKKKAAPRQHLLIRAWEIVFQGWPFTDWGAWALSGHPLQRTRESPVQH